MTSIIASAAVGDTYDYLNFKYEITQEASSDGNGKLAVKGLSTTGNSKTSIVVQFPNILTRAGKTYDVVSIADDAFDSNSKITGLNIVSNTNLKSIGQYAFYNCTSLTGTVSIPAAAIKNSAFSGCSGITSLILQEGVNSIAMKAFENCTKLPKVEIPASVTTIAATAFNGCTSITAFSVNDNNTQFSAYKDMLFDKEQTKLIAFPKGNYATNLIGLDFPPTIKTIGQGAFSECNKLTLIRIPYGVTTIEGSAFENSTALRSVYIPSSVTSFANYFYTFRGCTSLNFLSCNTKTIPDISSNQEFFKDCKKTTLYVPYELLSDYKKHNQWQEWGTILAGSGDINATSFGPNDGTMGLPGQFTVTSTKPETINGVDYDGRVMMTHCEDITKTGTIYVPDYVTENCSGRKFAVTKLGALIVNSATHNYHLSLGANVDTVGEYAFYKQSNLTKLILNPNLKAIEAQAFQDCLISHDIILPYGFYSIGHKAFYNNTFKRLLVPSTTKSINPRAFVGLSRLEELIFNKTGFHTFTNWEFTDVPTSCKLYVPTGVVLQYKQHEQWGKLDVCAGAYDFCLNNSHDNQRYFMTVTSNTPVTVDGVTYAGKAKYVYNPKIATVMTGATSSKYQGDLYETDIANNANRKYLMTAMGDSLLYGITACTSVTLPDKLERVGNYAFYGTSITEMTIPGTCSYLGKMAWANCSKLKDLTLLDQEDIRSWGGQFFGGNAADFVCYVYWRTLYDYTKSAAKWTKLSGDTREMKDCFNGFLMASNSCRAVSVLHPVDWRDMPIKAYTVSSYDASAKLAKTTQQNYTPANTGLIVTGFEDGKIYKLKRPSFTPSQSTNLLVGNTDAEVDVYNENVGYYFSGYSKRFLRPSSSYELAVSLAYLKLSSAQAGSTSTINVDLFYTGLKGDVDGNGVVDITDANILINIVLGKDTASNYDGRADVTGEGDIDVSDINAVLNIILGK